MSSIFSKIVSGEISCYKIAEDDKHLAFLDVKPLAKGHCLVIPKQEVDAIYDMSSTEYQELWGFAQPIAQKLQNIFGCKKVSMAVVGLEVPHAHIHLVPINDIRELDFAGSRLDLSREEFLEIQNKIQESLSI